MLRLKLRRRLKSKSFGLVSYVRPPAGGLFCWVGLFGAVLAVPEKGCSHGSSVRAQNATGKTTIRQIVAFLVVILLNSLLEKEQPRA